MNSRHKLFVLVTLVWWVAHSPVRAQVPGLFPWWNSPIAGNLGLSDVQKTQIRARLDEWLDRIIILNRNLNEAEAAMRAQFDREPIEERKATEAIEKAVAARAELTRAVSMMSLQLRQVLTAEQWRELQRRQEQRRPPPDNQPGGPPPRPGEPPPQNPPRERPESF